MVHSIRALCQNTGGARQLSSLRRPPSTTEKRTFQLCLDTRINITAPLGDDRSDTTAHRCSAVASAATSTVHHSVATSCYPCTLPHQKVSGQTKLLARGSTRSRIRLGLAHLWISTTRVALDRSSSRRAMYPKIGYLLELVAIADCLVIVARPYPRAAPIRGIAKTRGGPDSRVARVLRRCCRPGMKNETIPTRLRHPGGEAETGSPTPLEPIARHLATLKLEHRGQLKRVQLCLDPEPETALWHHRRPDGRVMRLRTESRSHTNQLVASDIPGKTVDFRAIRLLDREADREAWA